jgi:hypothetical protein
MRFKKMKAYIQNAATLYDYIMNDYYSYSRINNFMINYHFCNGPQFEELNAEDMKAMLLLKVRHATTRYNNEPYHEVFRAFSNKAIEHCTNMIIGYYSREYSYGNLINRQMNEAK